MRLMCVDDSGEAGKFLKFGEIYTLERVYAHPCCKKQDYILAEITSPECNGISRCWECLHCKGIYPKDAINRRKMFRPSRFVRIDDLSDIEQTELSETTIESILEPELQNV